MHNIFTTCWPAPSQWMGRPGAFTERRKNAAFPIRISGGWHRVSSIQFSSYQKDRTSTTARLTASKQVDRLGLEIPSCRLLDLLPAA